MPRSASQSETAEPEPNQITDCELILRFADQRDEHAFRTLVDRHGALVFRVCRGILRHHQDAEDAFQATFLVLARKAGRVRWHESLANWLFGTARRIALKSNARRQKEQLKTMPDEPIACDVFERVAACDAELALHEELDRLPEPLRAPLILCYLEGKTQNEAAAELAVTPGTINGRLQRGRSRLRMRLSRRGIGLAFPAAVAGQTLSFQPAGAAAMTSASLMAPPEPLVTATVQAAAKFASGLAPSGAASAQALTLAKGELTMLTSMTVLKLSTATAALLAVLGVSWLLLSSDASAEGPGSPLPLETQVEGEPNGAESSPAEIAADDQPHPQMTDPLIYGEASRSILLIGSRTSISAFSAHTGLWHSHPYQPAQGERVEFTVVGDLAAFVAGDRVYGFSARTGRWDSFEVPEDTGKGISGPHINGNYASVRINDSWYAFSSLVPEPKWVAMSFAPALEDVERTDD